MLVQKPLWCPSKKARKLSRRASETKVATQMGNQGHSSDDGRTAVEYVWAGRHWRRGEVHMDQPPLGFWPKGVPVPSRLKQGSEPLKWIGRDVNTRLAAALCGDIPSPTARLGSLSRHCRLERGPTNPIYHPFNMALRPDPIGRRRHRHMGAHLIDQPTLCGATWFPPALKKRSPTPFKNGASYPASQRSTFYDFPARASMPPPSSSSPRSTGGLKPKA